MSEELSDEVAETTTVVKKKIGEMTSAELTALNKERDLVHKQARLKLQRLQAAVEEEEKRAAT